MKNASTRTLLWPPPGVRRGGARPLVALHGCTLYQQYERAEALAYRSVSNRAAEKAKDVQELLERGRSLLEVIAARADMASLDPQRCADALHGLATIDPLYANIGVVSADGTLICSAIPRPRDLPVVSLSDAPWFRGALEAHAPGSARPWRGRSPRRWCPC